MKRWTGGFRLLLGIATLVSSYSVSQGQDLKPKFQLESSAGVFFFDHHLAFDASPSFGLGAGYGITDALQLNLAFSFTPTQQQISHAASEVSARYSVYPVSLNLRFGGLRPILWRLRPFLSVGAGVMTIDPHAVRLEIGAGQTTVIEPPVDHLVTVNLGAGLLVPLTKRTQIKVGFNRLLYKLGARVSRTEEPALAQNSEFRLGFVVGL
ncbi:MAG: outer membrane beta-barrel protein [bacterium]